MRERGAATVETAMFSVFLLLLVMGIVDLGRAVYTAIALDDVVQEGVMYGAFTDSATVADIADRVSSASDSPSIPTAAVAVSCSPLSRTGPDASRLTVSVSYDLELVTPFVSDMFGGSITLDRSATAERYFPDCPT